jgi:two-component system, chemotaxis family, sensor kinase CheA
MDDLTREFLIESQEGLDRMERCLTDLEERPQDLDLLDEIFRAVHTIKGTTGFLGFKRLETLAHAGENLLCDLRDGKISANQTIITGLLELMDGLRGILHSIETLHHEGESSEAHSDTELIDRLLELQFSEASGIAAAVIQTPVAEVLEVETPRSGLPVSRAGASRSRASGCPEPTSTSHAEEHRAEEHSESPEKDRGGAEGKSDLNKSDPSRARVSAASDSTLRVDVALLNRLMNLVGELVLTRNQILQTTSLDPNLAVLSRRLDMVTADLRESVMKARMQPVSNVFSKFPRIVRDLSRSLNRRVRLVVEGQETELDKSLLEAIKDPLTHAVRNSLDHGIEPSDVRVASGKDPEGVLRLRAYQESSHVIIEVSDDGAGIAVERVRSRAVERGLVVAERAARLGDRELMQLIFLPGFSTAEAVTNVSGRGVGMDVVRTNVEKIGGKVEIESRPGKGTTLRLRIPLTLAIIPALIVRSLGQSFALPQGSLSELVHIPRERFAVAVEWMEGVPLYRLRGQLLPLIFLDQVLDHTLDRRSERFAATGDGNAPVHVVARDCFIAVLDVDGRRFGLVVDSLADPEEIVVKPLSAVLKSIGLYSGATVLGNGDLALILDPGAIASHARIAEREENGRVELGEFVDDDQARAGMSSKYLLVETANRRVAVPLDEVLRIERIPRSRVEYVVSRPVLNLGGQLLPVYDSGGVLGGGDGPLDTPVTIVVCRDANRHVGIAVANVLDVAAGGELFEAGSQYRAPGVTLLKDHVTGVMALDSIPSLPVSLHGELAANFESSGVSETLA